MDLVDVMYGDKEDYVSMIKNKCNELIDKLRYAFDMGLGMSKTLEGISSIGNKITATLGVYNVDRALQSDYTEEINVNVNDDVFIEYTNKFIKVSRMLNGETAWRLVVLDTGTSLLYNIDRDGTRGLQFVLDAVVSIDEGIEKEIGVWEMRGVKNN